MARSMNLGMPRIGPHRELKRAVEGFWAGTTDAGALVEVARTRRAQGWREQAAAGIAGIPSNDFSLYDHVLDTTCLVGAVPPRFGPTAGPVDLDTYFALARGTTRAVGSGTRVVAPLEMTKWFDTNYHYLVPELGPDTEFTLRSTKPVDEFGEALALGILTRPVLLGPVTYLLLSKSTVPGFSPLELLPALLPVYARVLDDLAAAGARWIQLDEPVLGTDLDDGVRTAVDFAYAELTRRTVKILLATYFSGLGPNLELATGLPVAGLHVDLVRHPGQLEVLLDHLDADTVLSAGVVDGRNVWRNDLRATLGLLEAAQDRLGDRLWVGPSCSLQHVPHDLAAETTLPADLTRLAGLRRPEARRDRRRHRRSLRGPRRHRRGAPPQRRRRRGTSPIGSHHQRRCPPARRCALGRRRRPPFALRAATAPPGPGPLPPPAAHDHHRVVPPDGRDPRRPTAPGLGDAHRRRLPAVLPERDRTGHPATGSPRPRRPRPRRTRAQRHGPVLRRTARRLRRHLPRLGPELRDPLRPPPHPLRRRGAAGSHDRRLVPLRPVPHRPAGEGDADRPGDHPPVVLRPRRPAPHADVSPDRPGRARRGPRSRESGHRDHPGRRAGAARRAPPPAWRPRRLSGLGHRVLQGGHLGGRRRHPDPHPHVLRRVRRHHGRRRRPRRRRHLDRGRPQPDGPPQRSRRRRLRRRDRPRRLRHPLTDGPLHR